MGKSILFIIAMFTVVFASLILSVHSVNAADYRNAYMIMWDGTACDNLAYAKSMGYDYLGYQKGMEDCMDNIDMYFYLESPDQDLQIRGDFIYFSRSYTDAEKKEYNDLLLWKSTASFPYNIATGWYFSDEFFRPLADFQQQRVIDLMVSRALTSAKNAENPSKNFLFGGWSWDVPTLEGDLWSGVQGLPLQNRTGTGGGVNISYWTGTCSGISHPGLTKNYACYRDGKAAFYKKLFDETRKQFPNMKIYMEPYTPWASYIREISTRSDASALKPDILCEEKGALDFVNDSRIFNTGLITKDKMCCDSSEVYDHKGNLVIAGNAAINGAWYLWYGRFGGVGNFPPLDSIRQVPDRLKLIKALPGWDNINSVPLNRRTWSATKLEYNSTLSRANMNIIYSVHPKNKKTYLVILNRSAGFDLQGKAVDTIYSVDELFRQNADASSHFTQSNGYLYLKSDSYVGKGYIITLKNSSSPITYTATCSDSDNGNSSFVRGYVYGRLSNGSNFNLTDACFMSGSVSRVREYYCSGSSYRISNNTCQNGCTNGACVSPTPVITATCSDTDGGNNTYSRGTIAGRMANNSTYSYTDTCYMSGNTSRIREYYCSGNSYRNITSTCNYGCTNGACLAAPIPETPPEEEDDDSSSGRKSSGGGGSSDIVILSDEEEFLYCGDGTCTIGSENCTVCDIDCGVCDIIPQETINSEVIENPTTVGNNIAVNAQETHHSANGKIVELVDTTNEITGFLTADIVKEERITANTFLPLIFLFILSAIIFFVVKHSPFF
ncbi:MAG: hypothetical protein ACP5NW_05990 [Candidatus Woesearchaeota archaeon]